VPRSTRAFGLSAALFACSESYLAIEPPSDLRVIVTQSGSSTSIAALASSLPFELQLNGTMRVQMFPYRLSTLTAAFPALSGKSAEQVATALAPILGSSADSFDPPAPFTVLTATVSSGSATDVHYVESSWDPAHPPFSFRLAPSLACPQAGHGFRLFRTDDVGRSCAGTYSAGCRLMLADSCDAAARGSICQGTELRALPAGGLSIDRAPACDASPLPTSTTTLGISERWSCPAETCAKETIHLAVIDDAVTFSSLTSSMAWAISAGDPIPVGGASSVFSGGVFTRVQSTALYAFGKSGFVEIAQLGRMAHDGVDLLEQGTGTLVIGPNAGQPLRLSIGSGGDFLVLTTDQGSWVIEYRADAQHPLSYQAPAPIDPSVFQGRTPTGEMVADGASNRIFAVMTDGIAVLDVSFGSAGQPAFTLEPAQAGGPLLSAPPYALSVVPSSSGLERLVVCAHHGGGTLCSDSEVWVFDTSGALQYQRALPGPLALVIDEQHAMLRPDGHAFELVSCSLSGPCGDNDRKRYLIPPLVAASMTQTISVARDAFLNLGDAASSQLLAFAANGAIGMLDLGSGASSELQIDPPGTSRAAPVLYLGLPAGFAVALSYSLADPTRFDRFILPPLLPPH
jgi:hypothetical protein